MILFSLWGLNDFFFASCSQGLGKFLSFSSEGWLGHLLSIEPSMMNHLNSRIVEGKIICFMCVCQLFHFYQGIFSLSIFCLFKCSLKLSKKCSLFFGNNSVKVLILFDIGALNKSILRDSNFLRVLVFCDLNSGKNFLLQFNLEGTLLKCQYCLM